MSKLRIMSPSWSITISTKKKNTIAFHRIKKCQIRFNFALMFIGITMKNWNDETHDLKAFNGFTSKTQVEQKNIFK